MSEQLVIAAIGHRGDGVAQTSAGPAFVSYVLPGETIEAEADAAHGDRRILQKILVASGERIEPICPHFGVCGGCALQHWQAEPYRIWKRQLVVDALRQDGIDAPVDDLIDAHGAGRRRVVLHARRRTHDVLEVGFAAPRAHRIVAIDKCPILAPGLDHAIPAAWAIADTLKTIRKPLDIQITATDNGLDVDVRGSGPLSPPETAALARVAGRNRVARITRHGELVAQQAVPTVMLGRARLTLPPAAFLQATVEGEHTLARLVAQHCDGARMVADLFAGVGPFALRLAERARVFAADSDEPATAALGRAAASTPGLKQVEAQARDLFRRPLMPLELKRFDAVVFDPPRQGAEAQARQIAASKVSRVVAVSCNAATFARDARILIDGGYRLSAVTPVDQFRYSPHVEIVARFDR